MDSFDSTPHPFINTTIITTLITICFRENKTRKRPVSELNEFKPNLISVPLNQT